MVKMIFGRKIFICELIFKIIVEFLKTFGMIRSHFARNVSEQGDMKKGIF